MACLCLVNSSSDNVALLICSQNCSSVNELKVSLAGKKSKKKGWTKPENECHPDKIEKDVYDRVEIRANTRKKEKEMIVLRDIQDYYTSILLSTATKPDNSQTAMGRSPKS